MEQEASYKKKKNTRSMIHTEDFISYINSHTK